LLGNSNEEGGTYSEENVCSFDEVPEVVPHLIASGKKKRESQRPSSASTRRTEFEPHLLVQSMTLRSVVDETGIDLDVTSVGDLDSLVSFSNERDQSGNC